LGRVEGGVKEKDWEEYKEGLRRRSGIVDREVKEKEWEE